MLNSEKKQATDELFFEQIDKMIANNPKVEFYLATDSIKTVKKYKQRYNSRIFTYPKSNFSRGDPESIKEAMIELLILSKFKTLLVSGLSTYNEVAWWLGDCKAKVMVVGKKTMQPGTKKTSLFSYINQTLRRKSRVYRWIMRRFGFWA